MGASGPASPVEGEHSAEIVPGQWDAIKAAHRHIQDKVFPESRGAHCWFEWPAHCCTRPMGHTADHRCGCGEVAPLDGMTDA